MRSDRLRDYIVSVKTVRLPKGMFEQLDNNGVNTEQTFFNTDGGASVRIWDFWGGVYKRFYVDVTKDEYVTFKVDSNYSFNTIVSGVFFDPVGELKSINYGDSLPMPRKPTAWVEVLNNPEEYWWWRINAMDQLLCQRDNNPTWFYTFGRKPLLSVIRTVIDIEKELPYAPPGLDAEDKKRIRPDVGKIAKAVQLFDIADHVDFTNEKYETYRWKDRTALGRSKANTSDWDWNKFYEFSKQGIENESW